MDEKQRAAYLRGQIKELMRKVPESVMTGYVGAVRDFKKWHVTTSKQLDSSRLALLKLESIYLQAQQMYQ